MWSAQIIITYSPAFQEGTASGEEGPGGFHGHFASSLRSDWFEFRLYHFWALQPWLSSQACNLIHKMGTIMPSLMCTTVWRLRVYLCRSLFPSTVGLYCPKTKQNIRICLLSTGVPYEWFGKSGESHFPQGQTALNYFVYVVTFLCYILYFLLICGVLWPSW